MALASDELLRARNQKFVDRQDMLRRGSLAARLGRVGRRCAISNEKTVAVEHIRGYRGLLDGDQLVTLLIEHAIGVRRRQENILELEAEADGEPPLE